MQQALLGQQHRTRPDWKAGKAVLWGVTGWGLEWPRPRLATQHAGYAAALARVGACGCGMWPGCSVTTGLVS